MKQEKIRYIVEHPTEGEFETMAVSEESAINNIHYNLWFNDGIWTEMDDFEAEAAVVRHFRRLREIGDQRRNKGKHKDD